MQSLILNNQVGLNLKHFKKLLRLCAKNVHFYMALVIGRILKQRIADQYFLKILK